MSVVQPRSPALTSNLGTVRFTPASTLDRMRDEEASEAEEQAPVLDSLTQHVRDFFEAAKSAKLPIEQEQLREDRQIRGEYEPDLLAAIVAAGVADNFIRLTLHKCRDVESWTMDELDPTGDRTWDIVPSKDPEIPPDVEEAMLGQIRVTILNQAVQQAQASGQMLDADAVLEQSKQAEGQVRQSLLEKVRFLAEERCTNMENLILTQLRQGGWAEAFQAVINDMSRKKCAIMEGPIYRNAKVYDYVQDELSGMWDVRAVDRIIPTARRISFYDWYPAANSIDVDDGDLVVVDHYTRSDLSNMKGVPGYKDEVIDKIIEKYGTGYKELTAISEERFQLEKQTSVGQSDPRTDKIDCLNYWGEVPGYVLREWGMDEVDVPDPTFDYQINAKIVGEFCFRAIINPDPIGKKPYGVTSFVKSNDSQFGEDPAGMMTDLQQICNQAVRTLVTNIGIAGGPVWEIAGDRLAPGETADIWPLKTVVTTSKQMTEAPVVRMYQANLLTGDLLAVYDKFKREADDLVVPAYGHGNSDVKGAGRTMGGLDMLMSAASRNIKMAIASVDKYIIVPFIERLFNFNMRFIDDPSIKGDLRVMARGANAQMNKGKMAVRAQEYLNNTNNPIDMQIMGLQGRAELHKMIVKNMGADPNLILPMLKEIEKLPPTVLPEAMPGSVPPEALPPRDEAGNSKAESQPRKGQRDAG